MTSDAITQADRNEMAAILRRKANHADSQCQAYVNGIPYEDIRKIADMIQAPSLAAQDGLVEALRKIAKHDSDGLPEHTPQAMAHIAAVALASIKGDKAP